jgi:predicted nucleic acid-binding protein
MVVLDASVIVKIYVGEPDSENAAAWLSGSGARLVPAQALAKVGEVLSCKMKLGFVDFSQLDLVLEAFGRQFTAVPVENLLSSAVALSLETSASVYDCLYVALAARENCLLVTADRRLVAKMTGMPHAGLMRGPDSPMAPQ